VRVMVNMNQTGEAAGTAACLAINSNRSVAEIDTAALRSELARGGLWGNFGIRYGPLPTWIYQALLLLSHDPVTLVAIRAFIA